MRRPPKYRNRRTRCALGVTHHSMREANRCNELHLMQKAGLISDLEAHPQPSYSLVVNGHKVCKYVPDFRYVENGALIVEDTKGVRTDAYRIKARLLRAVEGIEVRET